MVSIGLNIENGELYTWGGGGSHFNKGQCGHGHFNDSEAPELVPALRQKKVVDMSCGGYHMVCITEDTDGNSVVYSWGSGHYGQLGNGEVKLLLL